MEKLEQNLEQERAKPKEVITAKGSTYTYLPDGQTQRFKKTTSELYEPQDLLVFVPPWEEVKDKLKQLYPHLFGSVDSEITYEQILLDGVHGQGKTIRIVDESGKLLFNNQDIEKSNKTFLAFIDKIVKKNTFYLPVEKEPQVGSYTFDARFYKNEKGEEMRQRHLGNKVTNIIY